MSTEASEYEIGGQFHFNFKDITGSRYGRWTVLSYVGKKAKRHYWLCRCDCGTERHVCSGNLASGQSLSCGCLSDEIREQKSRNKLSQFPEYGIWNGMLERCRNNKYYAKRGISVCERWKNFWDFYSDMGPRPSAEHSIDRIDNDGDYEPSNCRWATHIQQARNKSNQCLLTVNGITRCCSEWAEIVGISRQAMHKRIQQFGITEAVIRPKLA